MLSVAALLSVALGSNAYAASDDEIYKGKTVTVVIGYSVGGGYDMYGRLLARHMGICFAAVTGSYLFSASGRQLSLLEESVC
jgi:tripartite-type tricarboxylate transporter receptor subunit TctC